MYPILFEIGPIKLHMYGLMIAIGFLTILYFMQRDARKIGVDPNQVSEMAFWVLVLGVAATRVLHIIMYPETYSSPLQWVAIWNGGLVFQGAIPAAVIYAYIALKRRGIPFLAMADVVMPWVPLAQAFGRVGCFFNGCCYGIRSDQLPWGLQFPPGSPPAHSHQINYGALPDGWSYPIHPTQIYAVLALTTICAVLLLMRAGWNPFTGFTFPLYFAFTGAYRFVVEIYRGDGNPTELGLGLISNQQVFSLLSIVLGLGLFFFLWQRSKRQELPASNDAARP